MFIAMNRFTVAPGKGEEFEGVPIYATVAEAKAATGAPRRSAPKSGKA